MSFALMSPAFPNGGWIPDKYARDHDNVSPPLVWRDPPPGTKSLALIVEDPDAPTGIFRHWAVYDIDAARSQLPEGTTSGAKTERLGHGVNDFGAAHYDGPQPPPGHGVHHYHFRLTALDTETLGLGPKAPIERIASEIAKHRIAEVELVGTYERS